METLTFWNPLGHSRPVTALLYRLHVGLVIVVISIRTWYLQFQSVKVWNYEHFLFYVRKRQWDCVLKLQQPAV